ncbi:MAG: conjugative transposon protein TraJ, partial [Chitinophagaceae bacterium]
VGYFTVPGVANYIVHAGGGNSLLQKVNTIVSGGTSTVVSGVGTAGSIASDAFGNSRGNMSQGMADHSLSGSYFNDKLSGKS